MKMQFTAIVESADARFHIEWGDTVRIHDIYFPYYELRVRPSGCDRDKLPNLEKILLFCFDMHPASVWDEFDEEACLRDSKFAEFGTGSCLHVCGPVYRRRSENDSPMFGSYDYVVIDPSRHGEETDVNGARQQSVTVWLVEEDALNDEAEVAGASRLVVAWECAWLVEGER
jgi:hypothetical protein